MQAQQMSHVNDNTTEEDILMHIPFPMQSTFDKQCGRKALLRNIIHGDNSEDWSMDVDDEEEGNAELDSNQQHRIVRGGEGMVSHDSNGSIDSTSSTSSTQEIEPELSRSFGSTRSFDLQTPIKPFLSGQTNDALHRHAQTKSFKSSTGFERQTSLPQSSTPLALPNTTPQPLSSSLLDLNNRTQSQQRYDLAGSLGIKKNMQIGGTAASAIRSGKPAPPGLAGRLKIQLPSSSFLAANGPQTPGGHLAIGARDGAADGGPPLSPFEPPTPLLGPIDSPFHPSETVATPSSSSSTPSMRPKLQQRHTLTSLRHDSASVLVMSPITSQFAAVSMRKKSSSKGSTTLEPSTAQRSDTLESASTTPTSPSNSAYSPSNGAKNLPTELDIPSLATPERRTSASSIASNSSLTKKRSDVVRSSVSSNRTKSAKTVNKISPYPLSSRDEASPSKTAVNTTPTSALLRDVVKPPMVAPSMEKSISEPVPTTVSAKHLAHRTLHPVFSATYTLGDELGSGGFGFVVSATRDRDGMPVAVKFIFKDKVPSHGWVRDEEFGAIPMEAFVLKVVDSPFVVKFVDLFDDDRFFYLVMEHHGSPWRAPNEEGQQKKGGPAGREEDVVEADSSDSNYNAPKSNIMMPSKTQPSALYVASPTFAVFPPENDLGASKSLPTQVSPKASKSTGLQPVRPVAMARTSSCDLFECIEQHSKLSEDKARWVFAQIVEAVYYLDKRGICHRDIKDENCVVDSEFNVKLIDFGSSVITDPRRPTPYFNRFFGTMTFASSEILQGKQYRAPHAEIWSLGVLLSILLSGECPFVDPAAAMKGKISRNSSLWSSDALDLLMACLVVNPDKRATIEQIRNHPWVAKAWLQHDRKRPNDTFSFARPL
ncbi:hypothetical protein CBS101457_005784 [Exobasidium rhododendri]|nr:hypothetical protein CBS101457_005784 [Exobasidium rhododendri]